MFAPPPVSTFRELRRFVNKRHGHAPQDVQRYLLYTLREQVSKLNTSTESNTVMTVIGFVLNAVTVLD